VAVELPYSIAAQALGPTIVAATVAAFTIWIAFRQVAIARQQAKIAREKLKHDLYDRRYAIYLAFEKMLRVSMGQKEIGVEREAVLAANIAAHQSLFILNAEMRAYLIDLNQVAWRRINNPELIANLKDLPAEARMQHVKQSEQDTTRILHETNILAAKFLPFLKLEDFADGLLAAPNRMSASKTEANPSR
jgi:hypothetical protein